MQIATERSGIAAALELLNWSELFEIRALGDRPVSRLFSSPIAAETFVERLDASGEFFGIYCTFNPLAPSSKAASDAAVLRRRWLYIDVDPERPAGVMATAEEVNHARRLARDVITFLEWLGWSRPLVSFTGNGVGVYYAIDLPNDGESCQLVRRLLHGLAWRFNCPEASIDTSVSNASRITRIPGTWNRKGDDTKERPHRQAVLISRPEGSTQAKRLHYVAALLSPEIKSAVASKGPATRGMTPGDDYDANGPPFSEILDGWTLVNGEPDDGVWRRPGKLFGVSATTVCRGKHGEPIFHVFSSKAPPFEPGPYGKFRALAVLKFGGDISAAAKKLYADGWGERV